MHGSSAAKEIPKLRGQPRDGWIRQVPPQLKQILRQATAGCLVWSSPCYKDFFVRVDAPETEFCFHNANDAAHALGLRVEFPVAQQSPGVLGSFVIVHVKVNQTIPLMTPMTIKEIAVQGEECWSIQLMQQRNDFVVFHAPSAEILAYLPDDDTPPPE